MLNLNWRLVKYLDILSFKHRVLVKKSKAYLSEERVIAVSTLKRFSLLILYQLSYSKPLQFVNSCLCYAVITNKRFNS